MRSPIPRLSTALLLLTLAWPAACRAPARDPGPPPPLEAHVRTLGGAGAEERLPMIVALHGLGNTAEAFGRLFDHAPLRVRLVLLQAPRRVPRGGFSWFHIQLQQGELRVVEQDIVDVGRRIADQVRDRSRRFPTTGRPLLIGFSQGGILTLYLALTYPDLFAGAVLLGGWLPPGLMPQAGPTPGAPRIPVRALHGEDDRIVPLPATRRVVEQLRALGYDIELQTYPGTAHAVPPPMRTRLFELLAAWLSPPPAPAR